MMRASTVTFAVLFLGGAFGFRPAIAQHPKPGHPQAHPAAAKPKPAQSHPKAHAEAAHKAQHAEHAKKEEHRKEEHKKAAEKKHEHTAHEKQIIASLHKITEHLHRADHDYDNQRHEAVEHLKGALREMHAPEPNLGGKFGGMTQAKSDAILRESLGPLNNVRSELSAKGAPAHHHAALRKVDEAIGKIHRALKDR